MLHLFLSRHPPAFMTEPGRILHFAPGGEAVIIAPFMMGQTATEEYGTPDPELFDHVRGDSPLDFKARAAPFDYEEITPAVLWSADEIERYKIPDSQVIYR